MRRVLARKSAACVIVACLFGLSAPAAETFGAASVRFVPAAPDVGGVELTVSVVGTESYCLPRQGLPGQRARLRARRDRARAGRLVILAEMNAASDISFARGAPSLDIVPVDELRAAAARALENDPAGAFSYGTSVGYLPLRDWIAERHGVEPEQVIVTNGSMQADAFLFQILVEAGELAVVEAPTYDRTLLALQNMGAELLALPLEPDGVDVEALSRALEAGAEPKLVHLIPNFHNPGGATLSLDKRRRLLDLAQTFGFVLFEDDPYVELRFEGEPLPTMLSLDSGDRVVYASSFSKTVCPGIRVGYLVGPAELILEIKTLATNTYISPSMVSQAIVAEFCRSGALERSIEAVKAALRERRDATCAALERHLPDARYTPPEGGYFLWVDLPEGSDVDALAAAAGERGVAFVKGSDFLLEGGESSLRLAYSGVTPEQIDDGVARLAEAYGSLVAAA
jgi:2-aminoadipate transaminase